MGGTRAARATGRGRPKSDSGLRTGPSRKRLDSFRRKKNEGGSHRPRVVVPHRVGTSASSPLGAVTVRPTVPGNGDARLSWPRTPPEDDAPLKSPVLLRGQLLGANLPCLSYDSDQHGK